MVAQWGFANDKMGDAPVAWETTEGNGMANAKAASTKTEKEIDEQVQILVQRAYDRCYKMLSDNRALMDTMTERLIQEETIDYDQLEKMRDEHFAKTPEAMAAAI